jgi:putative acetyltransferase
MQICRDDLRGPEIAALLTAHLDHCRAASPPESTHALDLDGLRAPAVTFWSAWEDGQLVGCGALKELDPSHGEVKSMHTAAAHRGCGVALGVLQHIVKEARSRSYRRLSLETGTQDAFAPARALYAGFGFSPTGPFGDYVPDPNSVFMTMELSE